jgi:hypothetical protein
VSAPSQQSKATNNANDSWTRARELRDYGLPIIPLASGTKVPHKGFNLEVYFKRPATDEEFDRLEEKYPQSNFALVLLPGLGLCIVDVDGPEGMKWIRKKGLRTLLWQTTPKGLHLFFKIPLGVEIDRKIRIAPEIDLLTNGYVLVEPSIGSNGTLYELKTPPGFDFTEALEQLPELDLDLFETSSRTVAGVSFSPAQEGERNNKCTSLAGKLFAAGKGPDEVLEECLCWNDTNPKPLSQKEVQQVVASIHKRDSQNKPQPLSEEEEPASYPIDALGKLSGLVAQITNIVQVPEEIAANSIIAACALVVQPHFFIEVGDQRPVPSLFILTIAHSGERKSAVHSLVLGPHEQHQKALLEAYEKSDSKDKNFPLIHCEEPTFESITERLIDWPSLGIFSDEGGQFLGGYSMSGDQRQKTISGLSNLWSGRKITRIRVGRTPLVVNSFRVSMNLSIQPMIFEGSFSDPMLINQGLLARFLISKPRSRIGERQYVEGSVRETGEYKDYESTILQILKKFKGPSLNAKPVGLSKDAFDLYKQYSNHIESLQGPDGPLSDVIPFASKSAEQALRIACVIWGYENPGKIGDPNLEMSTEYMERGIELSQFYMGEAKRIIPGKHEKIEIYRLVEWLCKRYEDKAFSLRDIQNGGPGFLRKNRSKVLHFLATLQQKNWVYKISDTKWHLHNDAAEIFALYRDSHE